MTRASGRTRQVRFRYAANRRMRHAIDWWMFVATREDDWSGGIYTQARAVGQGHHRALRGLGARWTRILWRCWYDHSTYNRTIHHTHRSLGISSLLTCRPPDHRPAVHRHALIPTADFAARLTAGVCIIHLFCSYTFFKRCPHRMACARCDFYIPIESSKSRLLQAKSNLQRMLVSIPLTHDEQAAVEDGQAALEQLLQRLADVPTPARTTRQLTATPLPIVTVNHGRPAQT
ncbi:hypothetical protein [Hoyosella altamirensis]|uniref:Uncharacterized protein n=1 Tax=Hoyosella altamirensis TaxID=616997 RepID=A0A839RRU7_9ACTN|nr:hypothetical protein [Hoyosella altamirensis]MBB3038824.1 hypothetical protein [Hoyosella altamirensis]